MSTQTLKVIGSYPANVGIEFQELTRRYGSGYDQTDLVGPTAGTLVLRLSYEFLPDDGSLTVTDPETAMPSRIGRSTSGNFCATQARW